MANKLNKESVVNRIFHSMREFSERTAFVFGDETHSYGELEQRITQIQGALPIGEFGTNETIAVYCKQDFDTYACIMALWFAGFAYLPLTSSMPEKRCQKILKEANIRNMIVPSGFNDNHNDYQNVSSHQLPESTHAGQKLVVSSNLSDSDVMYVLFTSGSTGLPKGVPISRNNLDAFVSGFFDIDYQLNQEDRFLQMFEFTFDVSVQCYVLPLCIGASIYPVYKEGVRYLEVLKILQSSNISFAKMVPSTVQFLKPYFNQINLPQLKYSLFSGEGLDAELTEAWSSVVSNSSIQNFYGPTEATIDCTYYEYDSSDNNKSENGIVSIGKPFGDTRILICDEKGNEVVYGNKGELCVSGNQVTKGYLNNPSKNEQAFFLSKSGEKFYKTGDLVYLDNEGDIMFCGRLDDQVQIQGHRVELDEIKFITKQITGFDNVALAETNSQGIWEIHLVVGSKKVNLKTLMNELKEELPAYMIPKKLYAVDSFPYSTNGKLDKRALKSKIGIS